MYKSKNMDLEKYCEKTILQTDVDIFAKNARIICSGFSSSGKTYLINKLILKNISKFDYVIIAGSPTDHEITSIDLIKDKVITLHHFPSIDEIKQITEPNSSKIIVCDDNYYLAFNDINVMQWYTHGRHESINVVLITQNIFYTKGKYSRDISLNASHFLILRSRDLSQLTVLSRQLYGKENSNKILDVYKCIVKKYSKYPHLLVDVSGNTNENLEFRSHIIPSPESAFQTVYIQK